MIIVQMSHRPRPWRIARLVVGLALNHRRPPATLTLTVEGHGNHRKSPKQLTLMTWNLGYAGLGAEADFFMDEGGGVLAQDKATVLRHLDHIVAFLKENPGDIYLLQEVDSASERSYDVNELQRLTDELKDFCYSYAFNFDVPFVPYPLTHPMGRVQSGLLSLSAYRPTEATRVQLPGSVSWPISAFVPRRCLLVWRIPRQDNKEWVIVNIHLSSHDAGGRLRKQQLAFLKDFAGKEYAKGGYVIIGGDWNNILPGIRPDQFPTQDKPNRYAMSLPQDFFPSGWHWGVATAHPSNRRTNAPYQPGKTYVSVIDGFLVSPNIQIQSAATVPLGFKDSDHNPVIIKVVAL